MTGRYLTGLAGWLRDAGLIVVEWPGWQGRARGSGGYSDSRPWCVMWHHTASTSVPESDAGYIAEGAPDAPLANLLIDRDGQVWVLAAGATNTNGKGYAMTFSRGTVPNDQMNTHAVGIEIANDGVGGRYPPAQIDSCFAASLAITNGLGLAPTDVAQHHDWAPDRKIDPAVAGVVEGPWQPDPVNSSGSWSLVDLRAELAARSVGLPPEPPPPPGPRPDIEETDMLTVAADANGTIWVGNGLTRRPLRDIEVFNTQVLMFAGRYVNVSGRPIRSVTDVGPVDNTGLEALGEVTP